MAEEDPSPISHPTISPTHFDLIVSGTGLPESLIAAAASAAGKSVLHIDPNSSYGSHFSSLPLSSFPSFLQSSPSLFSDVEITNSPLPDPSHPFFLDLSGPRVFYCADGVVDVMRRSGASHHVEFKSVERSLVYWEGRLWSVPDSPPAIFCDRNLSLGEKGLMLSFLNLMGSGVGIEDEDLEMPFGDFLRKQMLPPKIRM